MTDFDGSGDLELSCEPRESSVDIINFGCSRTVGTSTPLNEGVGLSSNQRCVGRSRNDGEKMVTVECYNLADDTDFTRFVGQTEEEELRCGANRQAPMPRYFYGVGYTLSELRDGLFQSTTQAEDGPLQTESFNATKAMNSMFAVVVTEPIIPEPKRKPTTPSPAPQETTPEAAVESLATKGAVTSWTCMQLSIVIGWLVFMIPIQ